MHGRNTILKMADVRRFEFLKFSILVKLTDIFIGIRFCTPNFIKIGRFLPRDAMHKRGLCRHAVSLCVCVCLCVSLCVRHVRETC